MALDYLSLYGTSFQTKVIALLITDRDFISQTYDVLAPEFFESDANRELVNIIKNHFKIYGESPGMQVFQIKLAELNDSIMKTTITEQLRQAKQYMDSPEDLKFVKDEFVNFCKSQRVKHAVIDVVPLIKEGKYEEAKKMLDDAFSAGLSRDIGLVYENVKERYSQPARLNLIPTEWPVINDIIQGGLGGGDLGVFVGTAGTGKSWSMVNIGLHALSLGKNVLHFTLELNENYTTRRYDSRLTGITAQNLDFHIENIEEKVSALGGKLLVKYYPPKSASVITLKSAINQAMAFGFTPNIIIVDYADLLRSENIYHQKHGSYYELGSIYEDLRGMSGEYGIPIWTASQANKSAEEEEVITGDKVSESYKKVMTADFVISLSRRMEDKLANTARWYVIKNRYGLDGVTFPSKMDASIGKIEMFSAQSVGGKEARKDMRNSNELLRHELANAYSDFEENKE